MKPSIDGYSDVTVAVNFGGIDGGQRWSIGCPDNTATHPWVLYRAGVRVAAFETYKAAYKMMEVNNEHN